VSDTLSQILKDLLEQLPSMLTAAVCIVIPFVRWKRHPKVSLVVAISLILMLVHVPLFALIYGYVPAWIVQTMKPVDFVGFNRNLYLVLGLISNGMVALALAVLLAGIFMKRKAAGSAGQNV
jgi:hypothetical protein